MSESEAESQAQGESGPEDSDLEMILDIPVGVSVEVGSTQLTVREVLAWKPDAVVQLERFPDEPLDVYINDIPMATGEAMEMDTNYAVRIVDVASTEERIRTLG